MKQRNESSAGTHENLVKLAQKGDRGAMARLCVDYAPLIEASAKRYRGWRTDMDDLLQIGYEHLLQAILAFDESIGVYLRHFLKRRVQGGILTEVRRRERNQKRLVADIQNSEDGESQSILAQAPDEQAEAEFCEKEWADLFTTLSPRERLAIRYTVMKDYTDRELAEHYGVSRDTVKTWRQRGLAKLRKAWHKS